MTHAHIIDTVNRMAMSADNRDWEACRATFTDTVAVDYTSLAGGNPATIPADALMDSWKGLLPGFTATQHLLGSHIVDVDGDKATCEAHFQATHVLDDETWTLGGKYDYQLELQGDTWKIAAITMTALWSVGDQAKLLQSATERSSQPA